MLRSNRFLVRHWWYMLKHCLEVSLVPVVFKMRFIVVVLAVAFCSIVDGNRVRKCGEGELKEDPNITFSDCEKLPCKLRRKKEVNVEMKFTASENVEKVLDSVHAQILGVPFPFIGVDNTNICEKIFDSKGVKVGCPLKAGQSYVYKDKFPVLEIYPKIKVWVHWAIKDNKGKDVLCFEVPVKITS